MKDPKTATIYHKHCDEMVNMKNDALETPGSMQSGGSYAHGIQSIDSVNGIRCRLKSDDPPLLQPATDIFANGGGGETLFRHGEGHAFCVRQPGLLLAGERLVAMVELWNYTGNFCFPQTPARIPVCNGDRACVELNGSCVRHCNVSLIQQSFAVRISDDFGKQWSTSRIISLPVNVHNAQLVYFDNTILMHVKEKITGRMLQLRSTDGADSFGNLTDISSFFPDLATESGLRPAYSNGIVIPSLAARGHPAGRILMTGYSHTNNSRDTSCYVYSSDDGGAIINLR
jgi:hypothetical protein